MMSCLYLHIPFCRTKCHYCSFNSHAHLDSLYPRYRQALIAEILSVKNEETVLETLFIGGGTPTILHVEDLAALVETCRDRFGFKAGAEISLEANPESIDYRILTALREAGFNRVSIGIQSLDDKELKKLGRVHDAARAHRAVIDARRAGFDNLSIDLMYGLPGQTANSWRETLQGVLELDPRHLSAYQLTIEEHTTFHSLKAEGALALPAEKSLLEMDEITYELSKRAGFQQYEISNFAQPGYECRHNLNYWHNEEYHACGAGSVSYMDGVRERRVNDPLKYCEAVEQSGDLIEEREELSTRDSFKETVVMGLRLVAGISERRLQRRYGLSFAKVYGDKIDGLVNRGLVSYDESWLILTEVGRRFANQVMAELV